MRNLIFGINVTIDGCCDHTRPNSDGEVHEYFTNIMQDADLLVYGRKTYQLMVPFWPEYEKQHPGENSVINDFARKFNSTNKIVFSRTLENVEEKNTRIIRSNLEEEIKKLKQEEGKSILTGGVSLPSQLIELGLVDELHLVIHPIITGEGRRFLDRTSLQKNLPMTLIESKRFSSGGFALRYLKQG
jgi:dihydrofolate reductase